MRLGGNVKRYYLAIVLILLSLVYIGCGKQRIFPVETTSDGKRAIVLPDGRRFKRISGGLTNQIEERFRWVVPYYEKNGNFTHRIGFGRGGERIYETKEKYCLFSFTPEGGCWWYFDEAFELPKPKAEEFGEVELLTDDGEEIIIEDQACIQAFLDRLLIKEYDVKEEAVKTTDKGGGTITFYSREYPNLYFYIYVYKHAEKKAYYIVDWSNLDWIECTDIIEQYLSEYFE